MLKINLEYKRKVLFINLFGNLNKNTSKYFKEYTIPIIKDYKIKYMILNINNINTIDKDGYEVICENANMIKNNNGKILLIDKNNYYLDDELVALKILNYD